MRWILWILLMLAGTLLYGQKADTMITVPTVQPITVQPISPTDRFILSNKARLANKIQSIRDSLKYTKTVITAQDSLVIAFRESYLLSQELLQNREQANADLAEENRILREAVQASMPKWYENTVLWFAAGIVTAVSLGLGK